VVDPVVAVRGHSHVNGYATCEERHCTLSTVWDRGIRLVTVEDEQFDRVFDGPEWLPREAGVYPRVDPESG